MTTQTILVQRTTAVVHVARRARTVTVSQGQQVIKVVPSGPRGPAGAAGASYTHTQATPSTTWTINHNLGFRPSIDLLTVGGVEFDAQVIHPTVNQAQVLCNVATAGTARCN